VGFPGHSVSTPGAKLGKKKHKKKNESSLCPVFLLEDFQTKPTPQLTPQPPWAPLDIISGNAYEYLIKMFASVAGQRPGILRPGEVSQLIAALVDRAGSCRQICDPPAAARRWWLKCGYKVRDKQGAQVCLFATGEHRLHLVLAKMNLFCTEKTTQGGVGLHRAQSPVAGRLRHAMKMRLTQFAGNKAPGGGAKYGPCFSGNGRRALRLPTLGSLGEDWENSFFCQRRRPAATHKGWGSGGARTTPCRNPPPLFGPGRQRTGPQAL